MEFLWKEVSMHSPHLRNGELRSTSSKTEYLHKLLGIFQHRRFTSSLLFFKFIQSFVYQYELVGIYFILWIIIQYTSVISLLTWSTSQALSFGSRVPWHAFLTVGSGSACLYFLIFYHYTMLQAHLVYFLPNPRISHGSQEPWFRLLERVFETKIWDLVCLSSCFSFLPNRALGTCKILTKYCWMALCLWVRWWLMCPVVCPVMKLLATQEYELCDLG